MIANQANMLEYAILHSDTDVFEKVLLVTVPRRKKLLCCKNDQKCTCVIYRNGSLIQYVKFIKNSFLPAVLLVMRLYDGFVIVISAGIVGAFENAGRITVRKHFFNGDCGQ